MQNIIIFFFISQQKFQIHFKCLIDKLSISESPYLEFIQGNDNTHPALAEIIAIYLNVSKESYIIPISHLECINWDKDVILNMLANQEFCVLDKKSSLHAAPHIPYTDIQHSIPLLDQHTTQAHQWYYRKFPQIKVNKMIPIGKHLERCNAKHLEVIQDFITAGDRFSYEYFDDIKMKFNKYNVIFFKPIPFKRIK